MRRVSQVCVQKLQIKNERYRFKILMCMQKKLNKTMMINYDIKGK